MRWAACTALALASTSGCGGRGEVLPPHGEVLVVVDTDLPVPRVVSRLRVDLYGEDGRWFESRDIGRSEPRDWPASFSVFSDDDAREKLVIVRLRAYREGLTRGYAGERYEPRTPHAEPRVARSIAELCTDVPELPIGGRVTLRGGSAAITTIAPDSRCKLPVQSGSVAARVQIATRGTYRFDVSAAIPFSTYTTLLLRSRCDDVASQLACQSEAMDGLGFGTTGMFPRFDVLLEPGSYTLMTGNAVPMWPADITLSALPVDGPLPNPPPPGVEAETPRAPRLRRVPAEKAEKSEAGGDETPALEPLPTATVDRLVLLRVSPAVRGSVRVTLRGACTGTMAQLGADPQRVDVATATTCVDTEDVRVPLTIAGLSPELSRETTSERGTFPPAEPCDAADATATTACVSGGIFVMGSRLMTAETSTPQSAAPERVSVISRFWMDRYEVTVARFREAVRRGLVFDASSLRKNDAPFPAKPADVRRIDDFCSWSTQPMGREDFALTCVSWSLARAYCQSQGGDLPTEAQWEYVAVAEGRALETLYPWGDELASCDRAVVGRYPLANNAAPCAGEAPNQVVGPLPVTFADGRDGRPGDVSPVGIVGLAGGVHEWVLDAAASYDGACWRAASLTNPRCWEAEATKRSIRGSGWPSVAVASSQRAAAPGQLTSNGLGDFFTADPRVGFRCAYAARPSEAP